MIQERMASRFPEAQIRLPVRRILLPDRKIQLPGWHVDGGRVRVVNTTSRMSFSLHASPPRNSKIFMTINQLYQRCGSGSGGSIAHWPLGSETRKLWIMDPDPVPDPYYLSRLKEIYENKFNIVSLLVYYRVPVHICIFFSIAKNVQVESGFWRSWIWIHNSRSRGGPRIRIQKKYIGYGSTTMNST
jgi:hypothetical protein